MRIVVLGGGFGGVSTARHLEKTLGLRTDVEITLVSRENFFVLTPLLFEACTGQLELRHCAQPIRAALRRTRFIEATVDAVDVDRKRVRAVDPEGGGYDLPYDHLVVALGAATNQRTIPGSSHALTFKTMADALVLRNHLIGRFERADAQADSAMRQECLTVAVIGGGLVGVELVGELTAFADDVLRFYPRIRRSTTSATWASDGSASGRRWRSRPGPDSRVPHRCCGSSRASTAWATWCRTPT